MRADDVLGSETYRSRRSRGPPVIGVHRDQTVGDVLGVFSAENITSAPVWGSDAQYLGFVDVSDVVSAFAKDLRPEMRSGKYVGARRVAAMLELGALADAFLCRPVEAVMRGQDGQLWLDADCGLPLQEVVREGFGLPPAGPRAVQHRLGIFSFRPPALGGGPGQAVGAAPEVPGDRAPREGDGAPLRWAITDVVSQWDVVAFAHEAHLGGALPALGAYPVSALGSFGRAVSVPCDVPAATAFSLMADLGVSGLALTHPRTGALVGSVSASDMRGLAGGWFAYFALPVAEFVAAAAGGADGFRRAWEGQDRAEGAADGRWGELLARSPPVRCAADASLGEAVRHMALLGVHRVWVVDPEGRPVGVVTPADVLSLLAPRAPPAPGGGRSSGGGEGLAATAVAEEAAKRRSEQGTARLREYNTPFPGGCPAPAGPPAAPSPAPQAAPGRLSARAIDIYDVGPLAASTAGAPSRGPLPGTPPGTPAPDAGEQRAAAGTAHSGSEYESRVRREMRNAAAQSLGRVLASMTVGEAMAALPRQAVAAVSSDAAVGEAVRDMAGSGHHTRPVTAGGGDARCVGYFSLAAVLRALTEALPEHETIELAAAAVCRRPVRELVGRAGEEGGVWDDVGAPLLALAHRGLMREHRGVHRHRVVVCDPADGAPARVISQSDLAEVLLARLGDLDGVAAASISDLGLVTPHVRAVPASAVALGALSETAEMGLSATVVVDDASGEVVCCATLSDLEGLTPAEFPDLGLGIAEFVLARRESLAARGSPGRGPAPRRHDEVLTVPPTATLGQFLRAVVGRGAHRAFVVDDGNRPVGVVSLTDLLRLACP